MLSAGRQILAITVKELQLLRNDPPALALLFLMPAFFILVMSLALQNVFGSGSAEQPVTVLMVNEDRGDLAAQVISSLDDFEGVDVVDRAEGRPLDRDRADALVRQRDFPMAVVFPADFSKSVLADAAPVRVSLLVDPATNLQLIAPLRGAMRGALEKMVLLERLPGKVRAAIEAQAEEQGAAASEDLLATVDRSVRQRLGSLADGNVEVAVTAPRGMDRRRRPSATEQTVPAYAIFGVFFITLTLATSFVRERENGIDIRLHAAPVAKGVLLVGKLVPYYLVNLVQIAVMLAVGVAVFGLDLGNLGALAAVSLAVAAAANGLGLLIAAVARTEAQVGALSVLLSITLAALGGLMVPTFVMPPAMRVAAELTPHFWALQGFHDAMLRGEGIAGVGGEVVILLAFAMVFFALSLWRAGRRG